MPPTYKLLWYYASCLPIAWFDCRADPTEIKRHSKFLKKNLSNVEKEKLSSIVLAEGVLEGIVLTHQK